MSPQEQARNLIHDWIDAVGDPRLLVVESESEPAWAELETMIADALAASAAKVSELERENDTLRRQYQQDGVDKVVLHAKVDALTAKLEASESSIRSVCEIAQVEGLADLAAKLQASERALERVREVVKWARLASEHGLGCTCSDSTSTWTSHGYYLKNALAKLASPEARATGEGP